MRTNTKIYYCFLACLFWMLPLLCCAQKEDSLRRGIRESDSDTTKAKYLNALAVELYYTDSAFILSEQALQLSQKSSWIKGIGQSHHQLGYFYFYNGDSKTALIHYQKALNIWETQLATNRQDVTNLLNISKTTGNMGTAYSATGDYASALKHYEKSLLVIEDLQNSSDKKVAESAIRNSAMRLSSIGNVYYDLGDFPRALEYFYKSLKKDESTNYKTGVSANLCNIGNIYMDRGEYAKALDFYQQSLKASKESGKTELIVNSLVSIGNVHLARDEFKPALEYYLGVLDLVKERGMKDQHATILGNIGNVYNDQGHYEKALECYKESLKMKEDLGQKKEVALTLDNMGMLYYSINSFKESEAHLLRALAISREIGALDITKDSYHNLSRLYKKSGRPKEAFEMYKKFILVKDSVFNEENTRKSTRTQLQYEFDKKQDASKAIQEKKDIEAAAANSRKNLQLWAFVTGLILLMLFSIFLFNRFLIIRKQKGIIEEQKKVVEYQTSLVEEKQREILASIAYAKRIQNALITNEKYIFKTLSRLKN